MFTILKPNVTVVLPSYNPDGKLIDVINGLLKSGFADIIIVNDGSTQQCTKYFELAQAYPECTIIHHEKNFGKGAALKTAFKYYINYRKNAGIVTVDGDNQHRAEDIYTCAMQMEQSCDGVTSDTIIFGVRDFSVPGIPPRSVFGNKLTSFIFRTGCGIKLSDTQTGLRAIPAQYLEFFIKTSGDRFEYETNMILDIKKYGIPYREVKIKTIYLDDNSSSHFNPLIDSVRIYKTIIKFLLSSVSSYLIDIFAFNVFFVALSFVMQGDRIIASTIAARIVSSVFNFFTNRNIVFKNSSGILKNILKYYALCIPQMLVSAGLVYFMSRLVGDGSITVNIIKICVDIVLFIISFKIQRDIIFKHNNSGR